MQCEKYIHKNHSSTEKSHTKSTKPVQATAAFEGAPFTFSDMSQSLKFEVQLVR